MIKLDDFINMVQRSDLCEYISGLTDTELSELFGEDFARTRGFDQRNPHHSHTLLDHMMIATEKLDVSGLSEEDAMILKSAMFFHDIGKLKTATEKDDRLIYPGHAKISFSESQEILRSIGFSEERIRRIAFFIRYHDVFMTLRLSDDFDTYREDDKVITPDTVEEIIDRIRRDAVKSVEYYPSDRDFELLARIYRADSMAQSEKIICDGMYRDNKENKLRRADTVGECISTIVKRTAEDTSRGICVFGASSNNIDRIYRKNAREVGRLIAESGFRLVFGAGGRGLMACAAEGAHTAHGAVIGVIPEKLHLPDIVSPCCTELIITPTMHIRKATMEKLSDAFIALPGGFGTLEELLEIITLKQLGYMDMPIAILNTNAYYDNLTAMFGHLSDEGFASAEYLNLYRVCDTPQEAIDYIMNYTPQPMPEKLNSMRNA